MMDLYFRFFSVSRMSSARTDVTMAQVETQAQIVDDGRLVALARRARLEATRLATFEQKHRNQTAARADGEASAADKRMDVSVAGLFDGMIDEIAYLRSVSDPTADTLQRIIDVHFGGQVSTITRAPFEDELQRVERLYAELTGAAEQAIRGAGLWRWVVRIGDNLGPYRAALSARSRVTRGDLDTARRTMHVATCAVIGHICAAYIDAPEQGKRLLAAVVDQQDRIAAIMRARRQGVATGSLDDELIEGDGGRFDAEQAADAQGADGADDAGEAMDAEAPPAPQVEAPAEADPPVMRPVPRSDS